MDFWVSQNPKQKRDHSIKWLDLTELAKNLCGFNDKIISVNYFSATHKEYMVRLSEKTIPLALKGKVCAHKNYNYENLSDVIKIIKDQIQIFSEKSKRQSAYIKALESQGIVCDISEFGMNKISCRCCGKNKFYPSPAEKQTDVKIALRIISDAYENKFDSLILISEDSDFFPVMEEIVFKHNKEVCVAIASSFEKRFILKIKRQRKLLYEKITVLPLEESLLWQCQLPDIITLCDGRQIRRPDKYRHPSSS